MTQFSQLEIAGWQALLDRHQEAFSGIAAGARVGLLSQDDFEPPAARMLVWEADGERMRAAYELFPGFDTVRVDLLFVADETTLRQLHDPDTSSPFAEIRGKVHRRDILLYVVKPRDELLDYGYEDFLDSLGLTFMGACR